MIICYKQNLNFTKDFHSLLDDVSKNVNADKITLINIGDKLRIKDLYFEITDTQLLIYDDDKDILKAIDFADRQSNIVDLFAERNNPEDLLLFSQQSGLDIKDYYTFKVSSSIYTPSDYNFDLEYYYEKRKGIKTFVDKFYFRGNIRGCDRNSVNLLAGNNLFAGGSSFRTSGQYFEDLIKHKVGLSIPGVGELCFRDVEYMAVGIPMMRFNYITELNPPLIPNFHYISIDRIDTEEDKNYNGGVVHKERVGEQRHVDEYIKKFNEIREDRQFLKFISKNARDYYERYLSKENRLKHILNILEI